MSLAPIDFRPRGMMQEIPGMFDPRTGKTKYPQPDIFGGEIKPGIRDHLHRFGDPVDIFSGPYIPSDANRGVELFGDNLRFALIPRDDELGDIIRQQDRDIFDEYRRIDGENRDLLAPLPIRKAGKFITDLMA